MGNILWNEWRGAESNKLVRDERPILAYLQVDATLMLGSKTVEAITDASVRIKLLDYGISLMLGEGREDDNFVKLGSVK